MKINAKRKIASTQSFIKKHSTGNVFTLLLNKMSQSEKID